MSLALKLSIGLYCLVGLLFIFGGLNYVLRSEFMPYHAVALQSSWVQVPAAYQALIRALMIGMGSGGCSAGLSVLALAIFGLRRHTEWCRWVLPLIAGLHVILGRYGSQQLYAATPGGPPRAVTAVVGVLALSAFLLSLLDRRSA